MMVIRQPMLAQSLLPCEVEHSNKNILAAMKSLKYPVIATLKKDGIRALRLNSTLLSRTLKQIPNASVCERAQILPGGADMELWNPKLRFDEITSIVMSQSHVDSHKIQFHLLDWPACDRGYYDRLTELSYECASLQNRDDIVQPEMILYSTPEELYSYFIAVEIQHGEGICFRLANSPYKQGRSTLKEQYLIKLARYIYFEATIIDIYEQQANGNSENYNATGKMDRSSCGANKMGKNTLGGFEVITDEGVRHRVGTGVGLTDKMRKQLWEQGYKLIGKRITLKRKPHGEKNKPRSPILVGFRQTGY